MGDREANCDVFIAHKRQTQVMREKVETLEVRDQFHQHGKSLLDRNGNRAALGLRLEPM